MYNNYSNMPLANLKDIYSTLKDEEILAAVYSMYGIGAVANMNQTYAGGIISSYLESVQGVRQLMFMLSHAGRGELKILLILLHSVLMNMLTSVAAARDEEDNRFDNFRELLQSISFDHNDYKSREYLRNFVLALLSDTKGRFDDEYELIVNSIIYNKSVNEYDIKNWLGKQDLNVLKQYIIDFPTIYNTDVMSMSNAYLASFSKLSIEHLIDLLYTYNMYKSESLGVSIEAVPYDDELFDMVHEMLVKLIYSPNPIITDLLESTAKSYIVNSDNNRKRIAAFIWAVWLKKNEDLVSPESIAEIKDEIDGAENYYKLVSIYRRSLMNGENEGLVYAIYYSYLFHDYTPLVENIDFNGEVEKYNEFLNYMVSSEIVPASFKNNPSLFLREDTKVLFPECKKFREDEPINDSNYEDVLSFV